MKVLKHKLLLILTLVALVFTALPGSVSAAGGCPTNPVSDAQATAQMACVQKYIDACKKKYDTRFCESLTASDVNKCATSNATPGFNNDCVVELQKEYKRNGGASPSGSTADSTKEIKDDVDKNDCKVSNAGQLGRDCGIINIIVTLTNIISGFAAIVIIGVLVVAGIQYSMAGGDPSKVQAAKKKITNAVLALVLFIFSFSIVQWLVPGGIF